MNQFDPKKVEELLAANKTDEAKLYIEGFAKRDMTDAEKAEIHFDFALLYMKVMNAVKEARNAALREVLADMKAINKTDKELTDKLSLAQVRANLKK